MKIGFLNHRVKGGKFTERTEVGKANAKPKMIAMIVCINAKATGIFSQSVSVIVAGYCKVLRGLCVVFSLRTLRAKRALLFRAEIAKVFRKARKAIPTNLGILLTTEHPEILLFAVFLFRSPGGVTAKATGHSVMAFSAHSIRSFYHARCCQHPQPRAENNSLTHGPSGAGSDVRNEVASHFFTKQQVRSPAGIRLNAALIFLLLFASRQKVDADNCRGEYAQLNTIMPF